MSEEFPVTGLQEGRIMTEIIFFVNFDRREKKERGGGGRYQIS